MPHQKAFFPVLHIRLMTCEISIYRCANTLAIWSLGKGELGVHPSENWESPSRLLRDLGIEPAMEQSIEAFRPQLCSPHDIPIPVLGKGYSIPLWLPEAINMTLKKMQCPGDAPAKIAIM